MAPEHISHVPKLRGRPGTPESGTPVAVVWRGEVALSGHLITYAMSRKLCGRAGKPVFGTLVALLRRGEPVLGVIDQPITRERWLGVRGRPTTLNGAPAPTAHPAALQAALHAGRRPGIVGHAYLPEGRPALCATCGVCPMRLLVTLEQWHGRSHSARILSSRSRLSPAPDVQARKCARARAAAWRPRTCTPPRRTCSAAPQQTHLRACGTRCGSSALHGCDTIITVRGQAAPACF